MFTYSLQSRRTNPSSASQVSPTHRNLGIGTALLAAAARITATRRGGDGVYFAADHARMSSFLFMPAAPVSSVRLRCFDPFHCTMYS